LRFKATVPVALIEPTRADVDVVAGATAGATTTAFDVGLVDCVELPLLVEVLEATVVLELFAAVELVDEFELLEFEDELAELLALLAVLPSLCE